MDWPTIVDFLRDSIWNGIMGLLAIAGLLAGIAAFVIRSLRGLNRNQKFWSVVRATIGEVASWIRRLFVFLFSRGWKLQATVSTIIFIGMWYQHRATPYVASSLGVIAVLIWLVARWVYLTALRIPVKEPQTEGLRDPECLPLSALGVASDWARRYPALPLGKTEFNGVPFLLSQPYFDSSATRARAVHEQLASPVSGVRAVHVLINAGNAWKHQKDRDQKEVNLVGTQIGRIILWFAGSKPQEVRLRLGENVREWSPGNKPGDLVDFVEDQLSQVAWSIANGQQLLQVIDHLEIPVRPRFQGSALERIVVTKDTEQGSPQDILAFSIFAITLEH